MIAAKFRDLTAVKVEIANVQLFNEVAQVEIVTQPTINGQFVAAEGETVSRSLLSQPVLRVKDHQGRPLSGRRADVIAVPSSTVSIISSTGGDVRSDANGIVRFTDISVEASAFGDYQLLFVVDGVASTLSNVLTLKRRKPPTRCSSRSRWPCSSCCRPCTLR